MTAILEQDALVNGIHAHFNDTGVIPTGYRVLVEIPQKDEKTAGGIYLPEVVKKQEEIASLCARVLELGPLAYKDPDKFGPDLEPWCQPGDYIIMAAYSGTRIKVPGRLTEYRLINDDSVCAVVPSQNDVERP